mmetsp:Transcript_10020/g.31872  ORF Transcript_10020/g.31872 Transcript_10020/m.31872 type:complete len:519 (+) Transcript_10020:266-1822(+)
MAFGPAWGRRGGSAGGLRSDGKPHQSVEIRAPLKVGIPQEPRRVWPMKGLSHDAAANEVLEEPPGIQGQPLPPHLVEQPTTGAVATPAPPRDALATRVVNPVAHHAGVLLLQVARPVGGHEGHSAKGVGVQRLLLGQGGLEHAVPDALLHLRSAEVRGPCHGATTSAARLRIGHPAVAEVAQLAMDVGHVRAAAAAVRAHDQDVLRLQVAVRHLMAVEEGQSEQHLGEEVDDEPEPLGVLLVVPCDVLLQVGLAELHHQGHVELGVPGGRMLHHRGLARSALHLEHTAAVKVAPEVQPHDVGVADAVEAGGQLPHAQPNVAVDARLPMRELCVALAAGVQQLHGVDQRCVPVCGQALHPHDDAEAAPAKDARQPVLVQLLVRQLRRKGREGQAATQLQPGAAQARARGRRRHEERALPGAWEGRLHPRGGAAARLAREGLARAVLDVAVQRHDEVVHGQRDHRLARGHHAHAQEPDEVQAPLPRLTRNLVAEPLGHEHEDGAGQHAPDSDDLNHARQE